VRIAFEKVWPEEKWLIEGVEVDSEVSSQPMSDEETIKGAKTRALKAIESLNADFGVGLEGGLHKIGEHWFDCGWMVIIDNKGKEGIGSTIRAHTPQKMMKFVHKGIELGDACDIVFERKNTKHAEGQFGLMTNKHITRTSGYVDGVVIALASFINPGLFENE